MRSEAQEHSPSFQKPLKRGMSLVARRVHSPSLKAEGNDSTAVIDFEIAASGNPQTSDVSASLLVIPPAVREVLRFKTGLTRTMEVL
jgi:hypothetical protein